MTQDAISWARKEQTITGVSLWFNLGHFIRGRVFDSALRQRLLELVDLGLGEVTQDGLLSLTRIFLEYYVFLSGHHRSSV